jgi:hypothetical protein
MATRISSNLLLNPADITANFSSISDAGYVGLGGAGFDNAGNRYRFVKAGAVALVPGKVQQAAAEVTNHQNLTPTAASIGATSVTVTLGATAATENQYAGGWVVVTVTPGQGYKYLVSSHPAANSGASLTLTLEDALVVAITGSSRIDLVANPYSGVIVNPTTQTSAPVGAAVTAVTAAYFGWIQDGGVASLLADGANVVGSDLVASNGVAGAVEDAAAPGAQPLVGTALTGAADTEYGAVLLNLA